MDRISGLEARTCNGIPAKPDTEFKNLPNTGIPAKYPTGYPFKCEARTYAQFDIRPDAGYKKKTTYSIHPCFECTKFNIRI